MRIDGQAALTAPVGRRGDARVLGWLAAALLVAATLALATVPAAFRHPYVAQDDARQHLFWMARFLDPGLFPDDLIADYFESVSPPGVKAVYRAAALAGVEPFVTSRFLPAVLGVIAAAYCFLLSFEVLPVPSAAFLAALFLTQGLWTEDGLVSATPKAFVFPVLLAFLYHRARGSTRATLVALACVGLFYPTLLFVCCGVLGLGLVRWSGGRPALSRERSDRALCAGGAVVAVLVLLPYALGSSRFGPTIDVATAKALPEFLEGGRAEFFVADPWRYWLQGRSGIWLSLRPPFIVAGAILPLLLWRTDLFPLARRVGGAAALLPRLVLASVGMFAVAHAVLFRLHLPSRQTQHTLRLVLLLAAAAALVIVVDALFERARRATGPSPRDRLVRALPWAAVVAGGLVVVLYPLRLRMFLWTGYQVGEAAAIYAFLERQPNDALVASVSPEADNLPSFARRPILAAEEYGIPYHWGYYRRFRERALDTIRAQYAGDPDALAEVIRKYGVDFWLVDADAFTAEYVAESRWMMQFPEGREALARMRAGGTPVLAGLVSRCAVARAAGWTLLDAGCLERSS